MALGALIVRAMLAGGLIGFSLGLFEVLFYEIYKQKRFLFVIVSRTITFSTIITVWLGIINGFWNRLDLGITFWDGMLGYFADEMYLINLFTIFTVLLGMVSLSQISLLHSRGTLLKFILGRYHQPREVERIFIFIDLKSSTTIAEKLGHLKFGLFLKDYYSDFSNAILKTKAEVYQYVGDEIILSWSMDHGIKDLRCLRSFFIMKDTIESLKEKYLKKYGVYPQFKAGIHGGTVLVTWVGEIKKQIVYIGDILNTASRITDECKRVEKDFLISGELLNRFPEDHLKSTFIEELTPRGKIGKIELHSLEEA